MHQIFELTVHYYLGFIKKMCKWAWLLLRYGANDAIISIVAADLTLRF